MSDIINGTSSDCISIQQTLHSLKALTHVISDKHLSTNAQILAPEMDCNDHGQSLPMNTYFICFFVVFFLFFLAQLSRRLKMSYCDHPPSVVIVVRLSVRLQSLNNISS